MTLEEIVTFCRKHNILVWRGSAERVGEVELHFGPPPAPEEEGGKEVDKTPEVVKRRGKDGLTAAEQLATYGKVMDAEE